jgi:hypothetical protein
MSPAANFADVQQYPASHVYMAHTSTDGIPASHIYIPRCVAESYLWEG